MHELKESVCEVMTPSWDDKYVLSDAKLSKERSADAVHFSQRGQPKVEPRLRVPRWLQHLPRHRPPQHPRDHLQPATLPPGRGARLPADSSS